MHHSFWRLGAIAMASLTAATATAADFELPALNTPPSQEHHVGKVVWADLVTPNLPVAETFYGALFGWTFKDIKADKLNYAVAMVDSRPIGGILEKTVDATAPHQSAWLAFIAVRDVDAARRVAVAHGGRVVMESKTFALRGRQAVLADPEGAVFAVLTSSSGDSPDYLADPGEWIWSSVHAKKPDVEAGFYQDLFGYEAFDLAGDDAKEHVILSSDGTARVSVNPLPDGGRRHAHWLNFIRVESAPSTVAKALGLGAKVLVEPRPDRHGGLVAVLADPAGAPFGVMEWTSSDSKVESK